MTQKPVTSFFSFLLQEITERAEDIFVTNHEKQVCDAVLHVVYFIFANRSCEGIEIPKGFRKEGKNAAMKGVDKMIVFSDL